jgi:hypothetical protein
VRRRLRRPLQPRSSPSSTGCSGRSRPVTRSCTPSPRPSVAAPGL